MAYKIIEVNMDLHPKNDTVIVSVSIESSEGRFKPYQDVINRKEISYFQLQRIAGFGHKVSKDEALKIFPFTAAQYKFEG